MCLKSNQRQQDAIKMMHSLDFILSRYHYEGVGVNYIDTLRADSILNKLNYLEEK